MPSDPDLELVKRCGTAVDATMQRLFEGEYDSSCCRTIARAVLVEAGVTELVTKAEELLAALAQPGRSGCTDEAEALQAALAKYEGKQL